MVIHIFYLLNQMYEFIRVFHDKIKFYTLSQNFYQTYSNDSGSDPSPKVQKVKWCMKQTPVKVCLVTHVLLA